MLWCFRKQDVENFALNNEGNIYNSLFNKVSYKFTEDIIEMDFIKIIHYTFHSYCPTYPKIILDIMFFVVIHYTLIGNKR